MIEHVLLSFVIAIAAVVALFLIGVLAVYLISMIAGRCHD